MNFIWTIVFLLSVVVIGIKGPAELLKGLISASNNALSLSFELLAIYAIWLGLLKIVENTKVSQGLSKGLSPLIGAFWGKNLTADAKKYLSMSLATSVLGIGGASVPYGIKAVENMDDGSGVATFPVIMTIIFASSGVQLLPTTVMSLMTAAGSTNPSFIILPTILSGLVTTIVGVALALMLNKIFKKNKKVKEL